MSRDRLSCPYFGHQLSFQVAKVNSQLPPRGCPQMLPCLYEGLHWRLQVPAHIFTHLWHLTCHQTFASQHLPPGLHLQQLAWELRKGAHMQVPILCTPEVRQEESQLLGVCGRHGKELNLLQAPGLQSQGEVPLLTQMNPFPQHGKGDPCLSWSGCLA